MHRGILPCAAPIQPDRHPSGSVLVGQVVELDRLRETVAATLPAASGAPIPALIPFDEGAKAVLEGTSRVALRLGHDHVGTEHLLLAMLEHEAGAGPLTGLGVDAARAEEGIAAALRAVTEAAEAAGSAGGA